MQLTCGPLSDFYTFLYINHSWPQYKICWETHSGKVYHFELISINSLKLTNMILAAHRLFIASQAAEVII
jgi:hypothetical protein